ncbi:MAG: hypothetical protein AAGK04_08835, partial [Planctomycetota bacterium]
MLKRIALTAAIVGVSTGLAAAQTAMVDVTAPSTSAMPGDVLTITVAADYDTAGAPGGVFGAAGFYGFGGNMTVSGPSAADVTASAPALNAMLTFGPTTDLAVGPDLLRAGAGRGLLGGLGDDPATMLTFTLTIDPAAADGSVTLDFDGAVVLVLGDALTSFATAPGVNQSTLTTNALTINISSSNACDFADITADGACDVVAGGEGAITLS